MAEYQYSRLPSPLHVRLLEIHKRDAIFYDNLQCSLHIVHINEAPLYRYKAISYSWEGAPTESLNCGYGVIKLTSNGKNALLQLRQPSESQFVWMDAVCIKQEAFRYVAQKQQSSQVPVHGTQSFPSNNLGTFLTPPYHLEDLNSYGGPYNLNLRGGAPEKWYDIGGRVKAKLRGESSGPKPQPQAQHELPPQSVYPISQYPMPPPSQHSIPQYQPQQPYMPPSQRPSLPQPLYTQPYPSTPAPYAAPTLESSKEAEEEMDGQLALVPLIYAKAERVVIWLGDVGQDSDTIKRVFDGTSGSENRPSKEDLSAPVLRILQRSWFERLWVVPELVMANNPVLMCGEHMIPWDTFADLGAAVIQDPRSLEHSASARITWSRKVADPTVLRRLVAGKYSASKGSKKRAARVDAVLEDSIRLGATAAHILTRALPDERPNSINLENLALFLSLPLLSSRQCTLSIDRVRSFWSVLAQCGVQLKNPGSRSDYRDAFLTFTQVLLGYANSLNLWTWLRKIPGHLPGQDHQQWQKSWILDLNSPIDWSQLPGRALADLLLSTDYNPNYVSGDLVIKAKVIDSVTELGYIRIPGQIEFRTSKGFSGDGVVDILEDDIIISPVDVDMQLAVRQVRPSEEEKYRLVGWALLSQEMDATRTKSLETRAIRFQ